jgi:signal peptidase
MGPRKAAVVAIVVAVIALVAALPLFAGTRTYPIAIVEGNSMYPALQNGDIVFFHAASPQKITNGSIIVFVEGDTGMTLIDQLTRPVIVHRVVGSLTQADGTVYYETKGDNNQQDDPGLTPSSDVMGTPATVVPKVGLLFLFVQSPQGLVAIVAFIVLFYVAKADTRLDEERKEKRLIGALAHASLNGDLPPALFEQLETAIKYHDDLQEETLKDGPVVSLVEWVKKGGLDDPWKLKKGPCPRCGSTVMILEAGHNVLPICGKCAQAGMLYADKRPLPD